MSRGSGRTCRALLGWFVYAHWWPPSDPSDRTRVTDPIFEPAPGIGFGEHPFGGAYFWVFCPSHEGPPLEIEGELPGYRYADQVPREELLYKRRSSR
jgi:hypothetical protein